MNILYAIFIKPLMVFMEYILEFVFQITSSYGFSIIILSLVVNIVLLPLYYLAEKWQNKERFVQRKMAPELALVKKDYKGEERYIKTTEVYKKYNYHPILSFRTSFGFLIQVPFFIAAYTLLSKYSFIEQSSFLFIGNLAQPDDLLNILGKNISLLPFVMTLFNLLSSFIYTKELTNNEKMKLFLMAFLFLFLLYTSPAGLVLYWTMNNVFSLLKNIIYCPVKK